MQITTTKILFYLLLAVGVCFLVWYFSIIIAYIIGALVLALISNPLYQRIDNFKVYKGKSLSSSASAFITLFIILIICSGIVAAFVPTLIQEVDTIATLDKERVAKNFEQPINELENIYGMLSSNSQSLSEFVSEKIKDLADMQLFSSIATGVFNSAAEFVAGFFSVLFIAFFFLRDEKLIMSTVFELIPLKQRPRIRKVLNESKHQISSYFTGLLLQFLSVSFLTGMGLWILGISNPLLLGILYGLLNLIPYVGPILAGVIAIVLTATTNLYLDAYTQLLPLILKVVGVYAVVQFIDNWFLSNYIFSRSVEAHPLEIFIAILVGATLGGVVGMMVAIPAYAVLRIVGREALQTFRKKDVTID